MTDETAPRVLRLWLREAKGATPQERDALELRAGEGVVGDHTFGGRRHVTLVFEADWTAATDALGQKIDPAHRRANVLLSGGGAGAWIGKRMRLGACLLEILDETRPCSVMDAAAPGLKEVLIPDCRAGIWGRILEGGHLTRGDPIGEA